jgi:hypothetical protein
MMKNGQKLKAQVDDFLSEEGLEKVKAPNFKDKKCQSVESLSDFGINMRCVTE